MSLSSGMCPGAQPPPLLSLSLLPLSPLPQFPAGCLLALLLSHTPLLSPTPSPPQSSCPRPNLSPPPPPSPPRRQGALSPAAQLLLPLLPLLQPGRPPPSQWQRRLGSQLSQQLQWPREVSLRFPPQVCSLCVWLPWQHVVDGGPLSSEPVQAAGAKRPASTSASSASLQPPVLKRSRPGLQLSSLAGGGSHYLPLSPSPLPPSPLS